MKQNCLLLIFLLLGITTMSAQNTMRVSLKDGTPVDIPIEQIDSVTFVTVEREQPREVTLVGTWYWESRERGYSETLTFNADGSFTCIDHYFGYDFDSTTYGTYMFFGSILNLRSNGYGYSLFHQWMVTELTETKLSVMTKMGRFTYDKVK